MDLSLPGLHAYFGRTAAAVTRRSVLGIDLGATCAKVVQLSREADGPRLDTYGSLELGPYNDGPAGAAGPALASRRASAILDLLNETSATARAGGMAISLAATFMASMESPPRDNEQMRRIIPTEAQRYIPVPLETVTLDWQVIPRDTLRPLDRAEEKGAIEAHLQKVLIAAVQNEALEKSRQVADAANLAADFFEVEMWSAARSLFRRGEGGVLIVDLGGASTKVYALDAHGVALGSHLVESGGIAMTKAVMDASSLSFKDAEAHKRANGADGSSAGGRAVQALLAGICEEIRRFASEQEAEAGGFSRAVLCGGGAFMPGALSHLERELPGIALERADPFKRTRGPAILADTLAEVGPLYAVAAGLALRALQ